MHQNLSTMINMAAGREEADLVLKNAKIVNVFTEEIIENDIAIYGERIVGIGEYTGKQEIDLKGKYVIPGLIDGHVHIESAMVTPEQFAKAIVPFGTTTIIADPHEIANVCGLKGIEYILDSSEDIPLDVRVMLPSCVPSTSYENSGATLLAEDLEKLVDHDRVLGLGEMMNYPGVIHGNKTVLDKIEMASDKIIDGHGPGIAEHDLNAYVVSGIKTEHECTTVREMKERLRLGMYIQIREGSAARSLNTLIRGVSKSNRRRIIFCADDIHPEDILRRGNMVHNVNMAIENGISPIHAIQMATLNTAECYRLYDRGAIAPGYLADLVVVDNLDKLVVNQVFKNGKMVAVDHKMLEEHENKISPEVLDTIHIKPMTKGCLDLELNSEIVHVIQLIDHNIVTNNVKRKIDVVDGKYVNNTHLDILKCAVIERHRETGNIGIGLVEGYGLKNGAIASTIAHDSHNMIVIGDNDEDMLVAINELERLGGGITVVSENKVLKSLALPIAGLMSDQPIDNVNEILKEMHRIAKELHVNQKIDPFMSLAFIALPVIPEIKITDKGLFDVSAFQFIDINVKDS